MYNIKNLLNKRMPTFLALVLLLLGIGATSFLIQRNSSLISRASPDATPKNVQVTNVSDTSFTVVFTTGIKSRAAVTINDGQGNPQLFYDIRESKSPGSSFYSHMITVDKLSQGQSYSFTILSNGKNYLDNGHEYTAKTAPVIEGISDTQNPIKGRASLQDALPAQDTLVVAKIDGAAPVSALTNSQGAYNISLVGLRNESNDAYYAVPEKTTVTIKLFHAEDASTLKIAYLPELTSIPDVTLGQNYNFTSSEEEIQSDEGEESSFQIPESTVIKTGQIQISTPSENETFTDSQPLFSGTALANSSVLVIIKKANIQERISSSGTGAWSFRPTSPLSAGNYTLAIQTPDRQGFTRELSVSFTIFASGSQIAEEATPSATLTPTTSVLTSTPTPTAAIITGVLTPTATPTISQLTLTPTPTIFELSPTPIAQTPPKSLPPTGTSTQAIIISGISIFLLVAGSALLFLL